jgi:hypothetical protein
VYFVFHDELAEIRRFQGDFLDCIFCSIHSVTSFIHTAITAFAKLRKSIQSCSQQCSLCNCFLKAADSDDRLGAPQNAHNNPKTMTASCGSNGGVRRSRASCRAQGTGRRNLDRQR